MKTNWVSSYNQVNCSSERRSHLLKATRLQRGRTGIQKRDATNMHRPGAGWASRWRALSEGNPGPGSGRAHGGHPPARLSVLSTNWVP